MDKYNELILCCRLINMANKEDKDTEPFEEWLEEILFDIDTRDNEVELDYSVVGMRGDSKPEMPIGGYSLEPAFYNYNVNF